VSPQGDQAERLTVELGHYVPLVAAYGDVLTRALCGALPTAVQPRWSEPFSRRRQISKWVASYARLVHSGST
jgi:hypothetical protein